MRNLENRWASLWSSHSTLSERILLRNLNSTISAKRASLTPSTTPAPVCLEKVCEEKTCPVQACIPSNCTEVTRLVPAPPEKDCQPPVCAKLDCTSELGCTRHRTSVCPPSSCDSSQWIQMMDFKCSPSDWNSRIVDRSPPILCPNISIVYQTRGIPPETCIKPVCDLCDCNQWRHDCTAADTVKSSSPPTTASPESVCQCPSSVGTTASENVSQVAATSASVTRAPVTRTTRSVLFDSVLFAETRVLSASQCAEVPLLIGIGLLTVVFLVCSAVIFGQRWSLNVRQQKIIQLARIIELNNLNGWIGEFDELAASNDNIPQLYN